MIWNTKSLPSSPDTLYHFLDGDYALLSLLYALTREQLTWV